MHRGDLTNAEWERLAPLLPPARERGRRREDPRTAINGALYQARTGARWRHLPHRFGCWVSIYRRHRRWAADGTWERLLTALQASPAPPASTPPTPAPGWPRSSSRGTPRVTTPRPRNTHPRRG
ncbi:transposase [Nonomuraea jiangxiensis]|uniref:transposase n=1 Tax=Nonomuraea jiangxiensis TaxID=633440 RepID=UPI000B89ED58|nr:transposase [Nonomuraea jiangxiensis]